MGKEHDKRQLLIPTCLVGGVFFVLFLGYGCMYGGSLHPIGLALSLAPMTGGALLHGSDPLHGRSARAAC